MKICRNFLASARARWRFEKSIGVSIRVSEFEPPLVASSIRVIPRKVTEEPNVPLNPDSDPDHFE